MSSFDVLVVDDEGDVRSFLQAILAQEGLNVRCAENGVEALTLIRQEKPQLIVLDLMMPEMPGNELCRIIKDDPLLKDIIVFMLSARSDLESKLACFQSGAEEYIVKPVDSRELTARVGRFIKLVDELKAPSSGSSSAHSAAEANLAMTRPEMDMPSLALDDYSFLRFQSSYGNYRVESLVGKGGMGQVFKAKDEQLEREVAIKVLSPKMSSSHEFVERFRREAKVLAAINHPGIASIYSFSEQRGEHYFALQWCSGGSLADLIRKKGPLDTLAAVDIALQCAHALNAALKKGVVHRDIKPSNLMFDENQLIKIVDFGLAFAETISTNLTQGGEFLGTPSYMAPEQAKSPSVDHRADIYSLGITFYHMLYGKLPFQAGTSIEMVIKHSSHPFPGFEDLDGKIPRPVYQIIEKMTKKDTGIRYQDYTALIQDLDEIRNEMLHQSQFKGPVAVRIAPVAAFSGSNFYEMLGSVFTEAQTGLLTCRWNALEKKFLIRSREIVLFESLQPDENIWVHLVHKGILKKEDLPQHRNELDQPLNRFLLNNAFSMDDFRKIYRDLMLGALDQVFLWPMFEGTFATATIENDAFCTVSLSDYLLTAARKVIDLSQIQSHFPQGTILKRTPLFDGALRTLMLSPEESFIASRFEGENLTVDTLNLLTGFPEEKILRMVYALEKLGAIQIKAQEKPHSRRAENVHPPEQYHPPVQAQPQQPVQPPVQPPVSPPVQPPAQRPASAQPARISAGDQQKQAAAAVAHDYLMEIQRKRIFSPPSDPIPTPTPITSKESFVRMDVQKSEKKIEAEQHVKVAEQFYRIAERKFEDGDYYNVTSLCKQAIANNPTEAKYYLLMAKAYARHPRFLKDAETSYQKSIELDPWNPDYHVDLAEFYYSQGLSLRAVNECKKALSISPGHQRAQEMLSVAKEREK